MIEYAIDGGEDVMLLLQSMASRLRKIWADLREKDHPNTTGATQKSHLDKICVWVCGAGFDVCLTYEPTRKVAREACVQDEVLAQEKLMLLATSSTRPSCGVCVVKVARLDSFQHEQRGRPPRLKVFLQSRMYWNSGHRAGTNVEGC